jgi:hypothetical protein
MSTIAVTLTDYLKQSVEELAKRENLSTEEFISMTLSEKVMQRESREPFLKLLKKAPDTAPDAGDELN